MLNKLVRNSRALFIGGAILAVVAFALAFTVLSKAQQPPQTLAATAAVPTPPPAAPVLVAKAEVPASSQVTDPRMADPKNPARLFDQVPYNAYVKGKGVPPLDYVKGSAGLAELLTPSGGGIRRLAFVLPAGQALLASELLTNSITTTVDYSPMMSKGEVEATISAQPTNAGGGNIQPGDHVDLLVSYKVSMSETPPSLPGIDLTPRIKKGAQDPYGTWQSQTVIENARVLAVIPGVSPTAGATYAVAVSHQDAVILKWVKDTNGSADLVVRAAADIDPKTQGAKPFTTQPVLPGYMTNSVRFGNNFKQS